MPGLNSAANYPTIRTGPGVPEEKLAYLFRPFFTTKPEGEGNGLGLYLARELAVKNCGRITVASFQGYGTTFTLEFPALQLQRQRANGGAHPT